MQRLLCCVVALVLTSLGCADRSPLAPADARQGPKAAAAAAKVSGWVYQQVVWGDPPLAETLITVTHSDGSERTTVSDGSGFYELSVPAGTISITAFKEGYEAKTWEFSLLKDTVLNFGLVPM
jgi:hypothetical protein